MFTTLTPRNGDHLNDGIIMPGAKSLFSLNKGWEMNREAVPNQNYRITYISKYAIF